VGVVLADDVKSRVNQKIIDWLLPTQEKLLLETSAEKSLWASSLIQSYLRTHPNWASTLEEMSAGEAGLPISPEVREVIYHHKLYARRGCFAGFASDWLWVQYLAWSQCWQWKNKLTQPLAEKKA
jgi:hypothetical protein